MKAPMTKLMLAAFVATLLCLGARALEQDTDGYYMLGSVKDWQDFAALVDTNPAANAKMTADIDLGDDQTQIGSDNGTIVDFEGIFDGQGHTLTIKYNGTVHRIAPFRGLNGGTIKNLHVTGTINSSQNQPASIAAVTVGSTVISNVWSDVTITSTGTSWVEAGAFVGLVYAGSLTLKDCLFSGAITSPSSFNGCFVGFNSGGSATLANCLATGTFSYTGGSIAFCGNHSNCYVKQFPVSYPSGVTQPTDAQLADGTTATALQAEREETVWVQGEDGPMLAIFVREKETITWLNDDGTEIDTTEVEYGLMPEHADATKASDADFDYFFAGWSPELAEVESNTTYKAVFIAVPRVHSTGGDAEWSMDAEEGALRSGAIDDGGKTWFRSSVPRPCVLTFKWKASSEGNCDTLGFTINGAEAYNTEGNKIESISGEMNDWATVSVVVSNSMDVLEWKYGKDGSSTGGQDCAWIKDFEMAPFEGEVRTLSVVPNYDSVATVYAYAEKDCVMGVFPSIARYGYAFLGYFTAAEGGEEVEPPYTLSADTTLYAHWAKTSDFETTGGNGDWIIEEDGITWRSGAIGDSQKTWAEFTVKRPCTVTFKWKISSEPDNDPLVLYVDGEEHSRISGEMENWADISLTFEDSKNHVLKWEYSKDISAVGTYDCGWIRDFVLTPLDSWVVTCDMNYDGAGEFGPRYVKKGRQLDVSEFPPLDEPREGYTCWWAEAPWSGDVLTNAVDITADTTLYAHWVKQYGFKEFDETCQEAWTWLDDGSIRTGKIGNNTNTWATTSVMGPCVVSFKWKTSTEGGYDPLVFYVDGEECTSISGESEDWTTYSCSVDDGEHILKWIYWKDEGTVGKYDCGWIKDIVITAPESAPYTVTWQNADGTVLETDADLAAGSVPAYNSALPVKAADAQYYYDFAGWEPEFELVSSNTTYTAVYTATLRYYDVTWRDEDGTQLGTTNIVYGATPVYDGEPPTKATTAQYTYDFAGWTPNVVSVTGDATYTATYTQTLRYYTVTWKDDNGSTLGSDTLPYGDTPLRADPTKAATAQYTYTFARWNPALATVTNDVTYTATYDATVNKYTITFKNYDGSTLQSGLVEYGTTPAYAGVTPTKAATAQFDYTFAGWTPSIVAVTESASYTATYTATSADGWKVLNLSEQTDAYTAQHRDMLTGTLSNNVKISIADGATVLLQDVTIEGVDDDAYPWAGITCEGDAWLVIEGTNVVRGFAGRYPGVFVQSGKTLTIRGAGKLEAYSNGVGDRRQGGAGIGGAADIAGGNIVIESGTIIASPGNRAAGIGCGRDGDFGNITISGGVVTAHGGSYAAAIGGSYYGNCGDITITGGEIYAYGGGYYDAGIGSGAYASCGDITIGSNITKVVAQKDDSDYIGSTHYGSHGTVTIPENLKRTYSSDGNTLTLEPDYKWNITWLSDEGELIEVTIVNGGAMPEYAVQEKAADSPYRYIFTGWSPALALAVSNATYTATFKKVVDLETATADYTAEDRDEIVGTTAHKVTIPGGATVTINGVSVTGAGGGAAVDAPSFSESGESAVTKFEGAGNTWTLTAFAEMEGDSVGTAVTDGQIKVYAADSVEGLEDAEPVSEGVTVTERKSAVKTTIKVVLPSTPEKQFFKVKFGE